MRGERLPARGGHGSDPDGDGDDTAFVLLRAFASGSAALTGVESISNGVNAFRRPQSKNAAETLAIMGAIAIASSSACRG